MRAFLTITLTFALLVAGFATASARGAMAGTWEMVICTGEGMVVRTIGADGTPVEVSETCPDCVMSFATAGLSHVASTRPEPISFTLAWAFQEQRARTLSLPPAQARAPPALM